MEWDDRLARMAQAWAEGILNRKVPDDHRPGDLRRAYGGVTNAGENYYSWKGQERKPVKSVEAAIDHWYKENENWDFNTQKKKTTIPKNKETGHFTQLVWKDTTKVGCGMAADPKTGEQYVICNYLAAGNAVPANKTMFTVYKENVLKPKK